MENEKRIKVSGTAAFTIKVIEFDKKIAEAECVVSDLKRQKIDFIYNTNVQAVINGQEKDESEKDESEKENNND